MRGVLFDLDDTLLDHATASREAVLAVAAERGLRGRAEDVAADWRRLTDEHYARFQRREVTYAEQARTRIRLFLGRGEADDAEADALFDGYRRRYRDRWRAFDDALPALCRCREAGLAVGVLTNGEADIQTAKLAATGLLDAVDLVAASSDLPAAKPDPRAFRAAAERLGIPVEEVLMVGDSPENDVAGAVAAGARAVLLDRHSRSTDPEHAPVGRIASLDDLRVP